MISDAHNSGGGGWRVKLYQLESEGSWLDQGTGFVECKYIPNIQAPALIVQNEDDGMLLLQAKIQCEDIYERQGGTYKKQNDPFSSFIHNVLLQHTNDVNT